MGLGFDYASGPIARIHNPRYSYKHGAYKNWLRDEFAFRCVYCLCREKWFPEGPSHFCVEHWKPKAPDFFPDLALSYENLVYACRPCNENKTTKWPVPDPCIFATLDHLVICEDGYIEGLSDEGQDLIDVLDLDEEELVVYRAARILDFQRDGGPNSKWLTFPAKLPDLARALPDNRPLASSEFSFRRLVRSGKLASSYDGTVFQRRTTILLGRDVQVT